MIFYAEELPTEFNIPKWLCGFQLNCEFRIWIIEMKAFIEQMAYTEISQHKSFND